MIQVQKLHFNNYNHFDFRIEPNPLKNSFYLQVTFWLQMNMDIYISRTEQEILSGEIWMKELPFEK
jgi:hypothetical protein